MTIQNLVALGFLVFGGGFVVTLLMSIMKMLGQARNKNVGLGQSLLKTFRLPIIFCILLMLFIFYVVVPNSI